MPKYLAKIHIPIDAADLEEVQQILLGYVHNGINTECAIELLEEAKKEPTEKEVKTFEQLMDSLSDQSTKQ